MQQIIANGTSLAFAAVLWMTAVCAAQIPEMPKPTKEHELLKQFAGEWEVTAETLAARDRKPFKNTNRE